MKLLPRSLFGQTAVKVALALILFMVISLGAVTYFIMAPIAERSAEDFAAVIVSAANSFQTLPEDARFELQQEMLHVHGVILTSQTPALAEKKFDLPYYLFFRAALARHAGEDIAIVESTSGPLLWVDIPVEDATVRVGFDRRRVGANPPVALSLVMAGAILLTFLTSFFVVHQIIGPLRRLSAAVQEVGHGRKPRILTEDGPEELATLARAFNRMSSDMQELLQNRTVIVAGISHDLRTPLTRLGLAVEMLGQDSDPALVAGIRRDLTAMENLINQFLQFSKGLSDERQEALDLWDILETEIEDLRRDGSDIRLNRSDPCPYLADPVALQRVLTNLIENAVHHGGDAPIDISLECDEQHVSITISDRGPGIPADQTETVFQPFHRLEAARGNKTGGSGLGLAIARELANKHGWTIALLPREGGGTVAKLSLPVAHRL